jgi:hypothetical protein
MRSYYCISPVMRSSRLSLVILVFSLFSAENVSAYSVLTHEAIVDASWESTIKPFLISRYPKATVAELNAARAYAYGGSLAPDMGYYPKGSKFFTNLVHYVRSGDFVQALLDSATNINELAFAIGAISHYAADTWGHPLGTNISAPMIYPDVKKKFGRSVSYEEDPLSHVRTEFGFDVLQTARGVYASETFHDFIGFQVSKELLAKAFLKTYGLSIDDVFADFDKAVSSFRWTVKELFPIITRTAWARKNADIQKAKPGITARNFKYKMNRRLYQKDFGKRERPGFGTSLLSFFLRIIPKVGKLKVLKFKVPDAVAEKVFLQSFDSSVSNYQKIIRSFKSDRLVLADVNFDTGERTLPGKYQLADESYQCLLTNLAKDTFRFVDNTLRSDINSFFLKMDSGKKLKYEPSLRAMWAGVPFEQ